MPTDALYDYLAARFREIGAPTYPLSSIVADAEREGYADIWEAAPIAIRNAMRSRGLDLLGDMLSLPALDGEHFDPIETDFAGFRAAARRVIDAVEYPIPAAELVVRIGVSDGGVPWSSMAALLKRDGIFHLPGAGYWRHPQFTFPDGRIISKRIRSERIGAMQAIFKRHGWPVVAPDAELWSDGLITRRYLVRYASTDSVVSSLGIGLYVPTDQVATSPLPMTGNVAAALAALDPDTRIDDKDHLRLFRITLCAERLGWLTARRSRSSVDGKRCQTAWVAWTAEGRAALGRAMGETRDAF